MKKLVIGLRTGLLIGLCSVAAVALHACGCTEVGCVPSIGIQALDADNQPVGDFGGRITVGDHTVAFDCAAGQVTTSTTNHYQVRSNRLDTCNEGIWIDAAYDKPDLTLHLEDGQQRSFDGTVTPQYTTDDDFNGPGCGSCTGGHVQVVLR